MEPTSWKTCQKYTPHHDAGIIKHTTASRSWTIVKLGAISFQVTSPSTTKPTMPPKAKWNPSSRAYYPNLMHTDPCFCLLWIIRTWLRTNAQTSIPTPIKKLPMNLQYWKSWIKSRHKRKGGIVLWYLLLLDLRWRLWWQSAGKNVSN